MPEVDISPRIGNSKAGIQESREGLAACPSYPSIAPTMVCKVLSIGFLVIEQSLANPKLVFGELIGNRLWFFLSSKKG